MLHIFLNWVLPVIVTISFMFYILAFWAQYIRKSRPLTLISGQDCEYWRGRAVSLKKERNAAVDEIHTACKYVAFRDGVSISRAHRIIEEYAEEKRLEMAALLAQAAVNGPLH